MAPSTTSSPTNSYEPSSKLASDSYVGDGHDLSSLARRTRRAIDWDQILGDRAVGKTQWAWLHDTGNFSVYTKQRSELSKGYGVLAVGIVKGSVSEVSSLLVSSSQSEFEQKMFALFDKGFKHGTYVGEIDVSKDHAEPEADEGEELGDDVKLSLRRATFASTSWMHRDDEWCFMEASSYNKEANCFEKMITTLRADDMPDGKRKKSSSTKQLHDVVCGYRVSPEPTASDTPGGRATLSRVHFYAEVASISGRSSLREKVPLSKTKASAKAVKQRMLQVATSCDRLSTLVRRRRLGIQVLTDQRRLFPPTNVNCSSCDRLQLVAKLCRICGRGVCGACSNKHDRETSADDGRSGRRVVRVASVRVCDPCIQRVEAANYDYIGDAALFDQALGPDPPRAPLSKTPTTSKTPVRSKTPMPQSGAADLKYLLHDALLSASSQQRKGAVMTVIRSVLDQEKQPFVPARDDDVVNALDNLSVKNVPYTEIEVADQDGRAYAVPIDSYPVPANEVQRLQAVEKLDVHEDGPFEELNIICDIAAKELNAFATIVTIMTEDEQRVIGANIPAFERMRMQRQDSFCQHTVMDKKPLIVRHPEADVRFSGNSAAQRMGIKYYCGFPILSDDDLVIGTLCCLDQKSQEMTESQYAAMQKLAETASKVVKIQGDRKRRGTAASTAESVGSLPE